MIARCLLILCLLGVGSSCNTSTGPLPTGGDLAGPPGDGAPRDAPPSDATAGAAVGAPCLAGADCQTGQCVTEKDDPLYAGGYCTIKSCDDATNPCPAGSECRGSSGGVAICLQVCQGMPAICRTGYRCCGPGAIARWCAPTQSLVCMLK